MDNVGRLQIIEKIMPLCLALFFCRTVFIGYKYLFFLTLVPCVVYSAYWLLKNGMVKPKWSKLLLPLLVIVLFFAHFTPISNVVKESMNIWLILYFVAFSKYYYVESRRDTFLKCTLLLTMVAGSIAVIRFALSMFGILMPLSSIFFEGKGYSLVNDNNFYTLFFVISIIISVKLQSKNQITRFRHAAVCIVATINIILGISRRGYVLYVLLILVFFLCAILKKSDYKRTILYNIMTIGVFGAVVICALFFLNGFQLSEIRYDTKTRYYRIYSLIDNRMSFNEFDYMISHRYYEQFQPHKEDENLFYNGDLQHGLEEWSVIEAPNDCVKFVLIDRRDDNAIRVERDCGDGFWQVFYTGRPIIYHKNTTYQLSFTYKIIEGSMSPFYVGWWIDEGHGFINNIPQEIVPIDSVWMRCSVKYKFEKDHYNPVCFLNSLRAGSKIEVKDISLICDDTTGLPMYADQLPDSVLHDFFVGAGGNTVNYFTAPRTDRWRYALELWQTRYNTKQKIFGQGFKYLEWYGEKFYGNPKRYDFPHNPIISSFLYSGIIGGVVYIIFLIMSLWLYWKKRQRLGIFFIMYLCCMFFCMFSGSSHFSFPLFAFLSFLPFLEYKNDLNAEKVNVTQG
ncbi:MAG: hypothetical protein IJ911_05590 [Salinivirgaceae bacterium]|nr:hypothetical protein [Salinivirgaceae bacterium]